LNNYISLGFFPHGAGKAMIGMNQEKRDSHYKSIAWKEQGG